MKKPNRSPFTELQYRYALERIERLLPQVTDETPSDDPLALELAIVSEVVASYEEEHYPLDTLTIGEIIAYALKEEGKTQRELAEELGISTSRVSDFVNGRGEPSLKLAGGICKSLKIDPAILLKV